MNTHLPKLARLFCVSVLTLAGAVAQGQTPIISSFGRDGLLVCTNLQPRAAASVMGALSPFGPWTNSWLALDSVATDAEGTIRVSVPMEGTGMFYRVVAFRVPTNLALIPGGSFTMGDTFGEGRTDELPTHTVEVRAFYMERTEVTLALWQEVYGWAAVNGYTFAHAGKGIASNHPVHTVSWCDAVKWCNARSEKEHLTPAYYTDPSKTVLYRSGDVVLSNSVVRWDANGYRLPTEAEWEKAARGGASGHRFPWPDVDTISHSQANYGSTSFYTYDISPTRGAHPLYGGGASPFTAPVGAFAPNAFGLHDMVGNMAEMCWDAHGLTYYSDPSSGSNPAGPEIFVDLNTGHIRVIRSGDWIGTALNARCAARGAVSYTGATFFVGFRCARGF